MANLIHTRTPPKKFVLRFDIDSRKHSQTEAELMEWLKTSMSGVVYWQKTPYRDPKKSGGVASTRQHHFKNDYMVYVIWLTSTSDASLCKLMFSS